MSEAVGADIESICGKCGDVWHVVVAKVGDRIAKVMCKQCGGHHRHRPPGGAEKAKTTRAAKTGGASKRAKSTRATAKSSEPAVPEFDPDKPPRQYRPAERYETSERIVHPRFGVGVVGSATRGKMEVFFPDGPRMLIHDRPASVLGGP